MIGTPTEPRILPSFSRCPSHPPMHLLAYVVSHAPVGGGGGGGEVAVAGGLEEGLGHLGPVGEGVHHDVDLPEVLLHLFVGCVVALGMGWCVGLGHM